MEQMLEEARALVAESRQQIPSYPSADQVITVKTAKGNVYSFPYYLQERLMLLNVKNAETAVFLATEPGLMYKTLALMRLR